MVQCWPPWRVAGQLLVCPSSPLADIWLTEKLEFGAAVSVTACGWLVAPIATVPNLTTLGDNCACAIPLPVRLTTWGLDGASALIVIAPLIVSTVPGAKVTSIVQVWREDRVEQLWVCL